MKGFKSYPAPVKTCPACLSAELPLAGSRCKYCGFDQLAAVRGPGDQA